MAVRQMTIDKENINDKLYSKSVFVKPPQHKKALDDVNVNKKLEEKKPFQKNVAITKKVPVKPIVPVKPVLKRQESIVKPVPVQETIKETIKEPIKPPVEKSFSTNQLANMVSNDSSNNEPHSVAEYIPEIFEYMRQLEMTYPIKKNYLDGHPTTPKMRAILVNWLVEVHLNFKLYLETLHLCVSLLDRYLQVNKKVERGTLQLVGTGVLFVASKYEEMYMPPAEDFVYICDDAFSNRQLMMVEIDILKRLSFNLGRPLSIHFLRHYSKIAQVSLDKYLLGKYLLELALLEYELCHVPPSLLAAAACCLSIAVCSEVMDINKVWTPNLVSCSTYNYADFKYVMVLLAIAIEKSETSKYQVIRKKYASAKFEKISTDYRLKGPLIRKLTMTKK